MSPSISLRFGSHKNICPHELIIFLLLAVNVMSKITNMASCLLPALCQPGLSEGETALNETDKNLCPQVSNRQEVSD